MTEQWNQHYASGIAHQAAAQAGIEAEPHLLRMARTAVFRAGDQTIKLCPADHRTPQQMQDEARLTAFLHSKGFPVPQPIGEVFQVGEVSVVISEYIQNDPAQPINWRQLGSLLREIHWLATDGLRLQQTSDNDAERYQTRIDALLDSALLDPRQAKYLLDLISQAQEQVSAAAEYQAVLCHGDLQSGNILRLGQKMFLVDWEKARLAPPAFDLSKIVGRVERYGLPRHEYSAFCQGYGISDLSGLPGVRGFRNLSEVGGITYLLGSPGQLHQQQAYLRLSDLMNGTSSIWQDC